MSPSLYPRREPPYTAAEMLGMAVILAALCLIVAAMLVPGLPAAIGRILR